MMTLEKAAELKAQIRDALATQRTELHAELETLTKRAAEIRTELKQVDAELRKFGAVESAGFVGGSVRAQVVAALAKHGQPMSTRELADALGMNTSQLSANLQAFVKNKHVVRLKNPGEHKCLWALPVSSEETVAEAAE